MSSAAFERRSATYEDLKQVPDHLVAQLIDGELHVVPRPALGHASAASRLGMRLGPPFDFGEGGPGGWIILDEPELHLDPDVLVPDLAGWRRERLPALPRGHWIDIAPDWVCEVLAPSTAKIDRGRKRDIYARERVGWLWMIDPEAQILEVFRLESGSWVLDGTHARNPKALARPFDAIELDLERIWGDVVPRGIAEETAFYESR